MIAEATTFLQFRRLRSELQISQQQTRRGVMNHYIPRSLAARPPKNGLVGRRSFPFRDSGNFSGASAMLNFRGGRILNFIELFKPIKPVPYGKVFQGIGQRFNKSSSIDTTRDGNLWQSTNKKQRTHCQSKEVMGSSLKYIKCFTPHPQMLMTPQKSRIQVSHEIAPNKNSSRLNEIMILFMPLRIRLYVLRKGFPLPSYSGDGIETINPTLGRGLDS